MRIQRIDYTSPSPGPVIPTVSQDGIISIATYPASYIFVNMGDFLACNYLQGNHEFSWHFFLDGPPREVPWIDLTDNQRLEFRMALNGGWWRINPSPSLEKLGFLYDDDCYYKLERLLMALESLT